MRPTAINTAETILDALYDPQLSELPRWWVAPDGAAGLKMVQLWAMVRCEWSAPAADGLVLRMSRDFDAECAAFDRLVFCVNAPEGMMITLEVKTDAGVRRRTGDPIGIHKREEWAPLDGAKRLLGVTLELRSARPDAGSGWLFWVALQDTRELPRHLAQWSGYDERWAGYLQPADFTPSFRPTHGLLIDAAELEAVRRDFADSPAAAPLREAGEAARRMRPEAEIGEFVNFWNSNVLRREREIGRHLLTHGLNAAQAAVLFRDRELGRLAARFALSIAHCGRWEDVFMCYLRGSAWEQRSFVPSLCVYECALILDLCGEWFTELGRDVILRRIAEEGLGNLNFTGWWWEYIYHCNQLAWFAPGKMLGHLLLERLAPVRPGEFPRPSPSRVAPYTEACLAELLDNLRLILLADGGYVEGPTYLTWTARQAFLALGLYARARGRPLAELMPAAMARTDRMAEMLYSTDDASDLIPVGDAQYSFPEGIAYLAWFLPRSHWVTVFHKQVRRAGVAVSLVALARAREIPAEGPPPGPFLAMPDTGMMCSVREVAGEKVKVFLMGGKGGADHGHEDKGSFVLEFAGDSFAADFGMVDYSFPVAELLKNAQRHNMLTPWAEDGERPRPLNPLAADIRPEGEGDRTGFHATMDLTASWPGWFRRWRRTWDSPRPDTLVITDDWEVEKGRGAVFYWTTPLPLRLENGRVVIEGRRGRAEFAVPAGCEAVVEQLPLVNPERWAIVAQRPEMARFGPRYAATQPRLSIRQRGREGVLRIEVRLVRKGGNLRT